MTEKRNNVYGLTAKNIRNFMKENNLDPYRYDQHHDDLNDHRILDNAIKNTTLNYFSPTDSDDWILYQPASNPDDSELVDTIQKLYQLPKNVLPDLTKFVNNKAEHLLIPIM
jgi:hypothetical protein